MVHGGRFSAALTRPYDGGASDPARIVGRLTALVAIAAGVIHFSAAGDHSGLPVMLTGFVAVGVLQVALGAVLLSRRPSRALVLGALALTLGSVAVWVVSRTSGLPFEENGRTEPVGVKDAVCVLFELGAVPGLLLLLSREFSRVVVPSPRLDRQAFSVAAAATVALVIPALALNSGGHERHAHGVSLALGLHTHGTGGAHRSHGANANATRHGHRAKTHAEHARAAHARAAAHSHRAGRTAHRHTLLAASRPTHSHSHSPSRTHALHRAGGEHHRAAPHRKHAGHRNGDGPDKPHRHGKKPGEEHAGHHGEPAGDPNLCVASLGDVDVCVR